MVWLYPMSPSAGEKPRPAAWRTPTALNTLHPRWLASHTWNYLWSTDCLDSPRIPRGRSSAAIYPEPSADFVSEETKREPSAFKDNEILAYLQEFGREVQQLRAEVHTVRSRVFQKTEAA